MMSKNDIAEIVVIAVGITTSNQMVLLMEFSGSITQASKSSRGIVVSRIAAHSRQVISAVARLRSFTTQVI